MAALGREDGEQLGLDPAMVVVAMTRDASMMCDHLYVDGERTTRGGEGKRNIVGQSMTCLGGLTSLSHTTMPPRSR